MIYACPGETKHLACGSVDFDEAGRIEEVRLSGGVRLRRLPDGDLMLESERGVSFRIAADGPVRMEMEREGWTCGKC